MEKEVREMKEQIGCDAASVWLAEGDVVYPYIFVGPKGEKLEGLELKRGQGLCGYCIEHGEELLINDLTSDPRWYQNADERTNYATYNLIALPIIINGESVGCVQMVNKEGGFVEADVGICRKLVSMMVENLY